MYFSLDFNIIFSLAQGFVDHGMEHCISILCGVILKSCVFSDCDGRFSVYIECVTVICVVNAYINAYSQLLEFILNVCLFYL